MSCKCSSLLPNRPKSIQQCLRVNYSRDVLHTKCMSKFNLGVRFNKMIFLLVSIQSKKIMSQNKYFISDCKAS